MGSIVKDRTKTYHGIMPKSVRFKISITLVVALLIASISGVAFAGVAEGISFLKTRQNPDGGFSEADESSSGVMTSWALLAGFSSARDSEGWRATGAAAVKYLNKTAGDLTKLDEIELYTLAIADAGYDPRNANGINLVSLVKAHVGSDGKIGKSLDDHCWGVISLRAAGEKVEAKSAGWLVSKQREDGGWGDSDADIVRQTALSVEALVAAGEADADIIKRALKFIRDRMGADGGFAGASKVSDGQVTATAVRAIYAAGDDPTSPSWTFEGANPVTFLDSLQATDGHYRFSSNIEAQPAMTTAMALPSISGKHFPLNVKGAEASPTGEQAQGQPVHDLGTAGANAEADGSQANVETGPVSTPDKSSSKNQVPGSPGISGVSAGAFGRKATWFSGLWIFLVVCIAYIVILVAAVLAAGKIASPEKRNISRTNDYSGF